jgi:hypothetical protein
MKLIADSEDDVLAKEKLRKDPPTFILKRLDWHVIEVREVAGHAGIVMT